MTRKAAKPVQLIDLPFSAKSAGYLAEVVAHSTDHAGYAKDAWQSSWFAARRDSTARRNAVREALIAKYKL